MAWIEKYKTKKGTFWRVRYRLGAKKTSLLVGPYIDHARALKKKLDAEEFNSKMAGFLEDPKWLG